MRAEINIRYILFSINVIRISHQPTIYLSRHMNFLLLSLLCFPLSAPSAYIVYRLLKKPSLLVTVFNKHIALDLALSGEHGCYLKRQ